jgi:hypothetical protein
VPEVTNWRDTIAAYSGAAGAPFGAGDARRVARVLGTGHHRKRKCGLDQRPAPGDSGSLKGIARQVRMFLVDPTVLGALEGVVEQGRFRALHVVEAHLRDHLALPTRGDGEALVDVIVDTLAPHIGRSQKDVRAAVDLATSSTGRTPAPQSCSRTPASHSIRSSWSSRLPSSDCAPAPRRPRGSMLRRLASSSAMPAAA